MKRSLRTRFGQGDEPVYPVSGRGYAHVCPSCGHYADREVVAQATDIDLDDDAA